MKKITQLSLVYDAPENSQQRIARYRRNCKQYGLQSSGQSVASYVIDDAIRAKCAENIRMKKR
jgi:hypothetical protein